MGRGDLGQLGHPYVPEFEQNFVIPPRKIDALNDIVVKNLSCGLAHTLLVS